MARTIAALPAGTRITDYISLGVITKSRSSALPDGRHSVVARSVVGGDGG